MGREKGRGIRTVDKDKVSKHENIFDQELVNKKKLLKDIKEERRET